MSTRARIAMSLPDGKWRSIYTHNDGYPEHHGPILLEHYATAEKVQALMSLGYLSVLAPEIGERHTFHNPDPKFGSWCRAYGRDRGERGVHAKQSASFRHLVELSYDCDAEFLYVFVEKFWLWGPLEPRDLPRSLDELEPLTSKVWESTENIDV